MREQEVVVLNILPKGDFKKLHIKGSESLPLTQDVDGFCKEAVEKFGKNKRFIVYGERSNLLDSYFATRALVDHGMTAENYAGGLLDWHRAGMPVEGTEAVGAQP
jgi:rhodanese-related sulfurtransferase